MPQSPTEHQQEVYGTLNLYEAVLNLCFHVQNRHIPSTEADNLYVHLGLAEALQDCLETIAEALPKSPPEQLLPNSISGMTESEHRKLQGYFGVIKRYAHDINAHAATIRPEVQSFIDDAETVLNGGRLQTSVLLSESTVSDYNYDTKTLTINEIPLVFEGIQEDYFLWAMFQQPLNVSVSWDEIIDMVRAEFRDEQVFRNGSVSVRQTMHRINRKIKREIQTKDSLFSYKSNGYKRHFGPEVTS
jgi:hypothetical protein